MPGFVFFRHPEGVSDLWQWRWQAMLQLDNGQEVCPNEFRVAPGANPATLIPLAEIVVPHRGKPLPDGVYNGRNKARCADMEETL